MNLPLYTVILWSGHYTFFELLIFIIEHDCASGDSPVFHNICIVWTFLSLLEFDLDFTYVCRWYNGLLLARFLFFIFLFFIFIFTIIVVDGRRALFSVDVLGGLVRELDPFVTQTRLEESADLTDWHSSYDWMSGACCNIWHFQVNSLHCRLSIISLLIITTT